MAFRRQWAEFTVMIYLFSGPPRRTRGSIFDRPRLFLYFFIFLLALGVNFDQSGQGQFTEKLRKRSNSLDQKPWWESGFNDGFSGVKFHDFSSPKFSPKTSPENGLKTTPKLPCNLFWSTP
jgi:hypothetical protein